jgi:ABC-type nitrate/sulfonate/bicarbonate transport system substrate-binding protein
VRKRLWLIVAVVLLVLGSSVYLMRPVEPDRVTLTIPTSSFSFLWIYVGLDEEIFEDEGIDLEIVESRPASTAVQAVMAGSAQFTGAAESAASAMLQGGDLRIVVYWMLNKEMLLMAGPEIESVEDLRGGTVAVSRLRSQNAVVAEEVLSALGLEPGVDVEMVAVGGSSSRMAALRQGLVDAAFDSPPDVQLLEDLGFRVLVRGW